MKKAERKKYRHGKTERLLLGEKSSGFSLFSLAPFSIHALFDTMIFPTHRRDDFMNQFTSAVPDVSRPLIAPAL